MVICNIVLDDKTLISDKYINCPAINVIEDITFINTCVPTLFYGHDVAKKHLGDAFNRKYRKINDSYWWSYTDQEVSFDNWIDEFVDMAQRMWFKCINSGIDVVFDKAFDLSAFVDHLDPWPLIHEGTYEIYVGDWRDGVIVVHSIKKDTLEYMDIDPKKWMKAMYEQLNYNFLSINAKAFDLKQRPIPIFLDDLLFANMDEWYGIDEIIDHFNASGVVIDRTKVITYYLKQSQFLLLLCFFQHFLFNIIFPPAFQVLNIIS